MNAKNLKVSMAGIGIMGTPMARNLIKGGCDLHIYARRPGMAEPLVTLGAKLHPTPALAAKECDFHITIVGDSADVTEIMLGDNGITHTAKKGSIAIDMSTISSKTSIEIANTLREKGVEMLDAPVSGGETGAIHASLSIMVGGKESVFQRALPLLKMLGLTITHVGTNGTGQTVKTCNQCLVAQTVVAIAEAMQFAESNGVDKQKMRDSLLGGFGASTALKIHGQRIINEDYTPGFRVALHLKDLNIAYDLCQQKGIFLPSLFQARRYLERVVALLGPNVDSSAIAEIIKEIASTKIHISE